ncbi:centromere/kinetochore protein, putative (ZW10) [Quillaja saponaria]|uniref:Centromere/kinetochore protein, putative (ZW10) n=1 Tax=Quillaja saponaria TaxID=32244 RepID=A0AAD7Q060_QUISA|nr:centromere/kinetochore protein, putative (ZW10) [Quillaja saponaria]
MIRTFSIPFQLPSNQLDELIVRLNQRLRSSPPTTFPTQPHLSPHLISATLYNGLSLTPSKLIQSPILPYSHHQDFSNLFSLCNNAISQSYHISSDVSNILKLISDRPIDAEIWEIVEELKVKRELLILVRAIVEMNQRLKGVKEGLRNGRLKFVSEEVKDLKWCSGFLMIIRLTTKSQWCMGLSRKEWSQCFKDVRLHG